MPDHRSVLPDTATRAPGEAGEALSPTEVEVAIVVPIYNEIHRLGVVRDFLTQLTNEADRVARSWHIVLVDDGSDDGTSDWLRGFCQELSRYRPALGGLHLIRLTQNSCKSGVLAGACQHIHAARYVFVDCDGSFHTTDVSRVVAELEHADLVVGRRHFLGRRWLRRQVTGLIRRLTRPLLPENIDDSQSGLKGFRGTIARQLATYNFRSAGLSFDLAMLSCARNLGRHEPSSSSVDVYIEDRDGSHVQLFRDGLGFIRVYLKLIIARKPKLFLSWPEATYQKSSLLPLAQDHH